ncbi:hypothetical protein HK100_010733 [Physocladia obscura]|uniref:Acetyl-coenzyme A transporter 1 n=1 Tax=Physocladia obscura TaxID=109957 RepID=A0AAD5T4U2_9FUNG|nr:hypothetical protein HK100_010733 [Physocladia obscura]
MRNKRNSSHSTIDMKTNTESAAKQRRKTPSSSPELNAAAKTASLNSNSKPKPKEIRDELGDFILLVVLCESFVHQFEGMFIRSYASLDLLQGVPLGLVLGSVPFLLKSKLSFSDIALFSLSSYPYSLKIFKAITGIFLLVLSRSIDSYVSPESTTPVPVTFLAITFASLVFLCATQDIAVDGWALTLLTDENKAYASTAQTIGLNSGYFLSFTVFLALNSKEFCVKYLGLKNEAILLGSGIMFLICDLWLIFIKREGMELEEPAKNEIQIVYHHIFQVITLPNMRRLIAMILISKIGFMAQDSVTALKLLEKGFSKEDLALTVLIDFPIQIFVGYYVAKWSKGPKPLRPWLTAFYIRLLFSGLGMIIVRFVPEKISTTVMFVGIGSYFTKISDPRIGGTYMTLLNTINNLAGTWPKYFILQSVESFTTASCIVPTFSPNYTEPFTCISDSEKARCKALDGGACNLTRDGYYPVAITCLVIGVAVLLFVVRPTVSFLEKVPEAAWRIPRDNDEEVEALVSRSEMHSSKEAVKYD